MLAFDEAGLLSLARRADCVIELVPQVGDHVSAGDPLFRVCGGGAALAPESLCQSVAVGQERTLEQDPTFAFRIIVDIACKALSPAINDPTTAVLAVDQIHHLLRVVSGRYLDNGKCARRRRPAASHLPDAGLGRFCSPGQLAILDGDPQMGKSFVALDLCARLSAGRPFPDGASRDAVFCRVDGRQGHYIGWLPLLRVPPTHSLGIANFRQGSIFRLREEALRGPVQQRQTG